MWMNELHDKPVMSIAEGTTLGSVRDVLLDDSYLQVAALVVGGGGLLGGHRKAVAYSAIRGIGPDAVMVGGPDTVQEVTETSTWGVSHRGEEMRQDVLTEGGVRLGRVADVAFDPLTGELTALRLLPTGAVEPASGEESVIARADIMTLTAKLVVVRHAVIAERASEAAPAPPAGFTVASRPERADGPGSRDVADHTARSSS